MKTALFAAPGFNKLSCACCMLCPYSLTPTEWTTRTNNISWRRKTLIFNRANIRHSNESCPPLHLDVWMALFILEDALRGQIFVVRLVMRLKYKDGRKTHYPSRLIIFRCADNESSSSRGTKRLVAVFILETHNQTNNRSLLDFVQMSCSIKTANEYQISLLSAWEICYSVSRMILSYLS